MPERSPSPQMSAWIIVAMLAMIAVPAGIALHTVRAPAVVQMTSTNPTPYGYSWSLLLFVVPIVVIGWWFLRSEGVRISQRAFWRTIWILVPAGFGLDFFFASHFFLFSNTRATFGNRRPGPRWQCSHRGIHLLLHRVRYDTSALRVAG